MKEKIMLLVDDIEVNRSVLEECFRGEFTVLHAQGGRQAIQIVEQYRNRITIVLLDIMMPDLDGISVLKWMAQSDYHTIPVIAVTAESGYQLEALEAGAWDFIPKPADNQIIRARVHNVLGRYAFDEERRRSEQLMKNTHEMNNLVNSIPGGIAIYKLTARGFETQYFSDGIAQLTGHTREEYAQTIGVDAASIVYHGDRHRLVDAAIATLKCGKPIDETYRIYHKNGSLVWVRLNGTVIGEEDGAPLIHAVVQSPPRMAQLYDNLVNETPSIIYVSDMNNYDLMYVNQTGLQQLGKENDDYSGRKCYEFLMDQNAPCPFCKLNIMSTKAFLKREFQSPQSGTIYSLRGKVTDWNGIAAHVEYIQDITDIRAAERQNAELSKQLQSVMEHIPGGMCMYRTDKTGSYPVVYNQAFIDIFGYLPEHQAAALTKTDYSNVHPDDLPELRRKLDEALGANARINHTYRSFSEVENKYIWINLNGVIVPQEDGSKLCYASYADVTAERETQEKLIHTQRVLEELRQHAQRALDNYQVLVNAVPGGIAQYELVDGQVITRFVSDGLCELSGYSRDERELMSSQDMLSLTFEEDLPRLLAAIDHAVANRESLSITYRICTKCGVPRWVHLNAAYAPGAHGECFYQAVFTDVDKLKKTEQELQENQLRYEVAVKNSGINIWEYDIQNDSLSVISGASRIKQNCSRIENYTRLALEHGYVRQDSIAGFLSVFERLRRGDKAVTEDIWYQTNDGIGWWCERVTYTTVYDDAGRPVRAFGAGRDVTRERDAEKKFREELSYRKAIQSDNLSTVSVDLTENRILEISSNFETVTGLEGSTATEYFAQTATRVIGAANRKQYEKVFTPKALLHYFDTGEFTISLELTRLYDSNKVYWINYSAHLIQNPETGHVIAHISCVDITHEKVMQTIMETIAKTDYDSFVVVDGVSDSALDYGIGSKKHRYDERMSFEAQNETWLHEHVCMEDMERVIANCKIKHVWAQIKDGDTYKFSFGMRMPDGTIRRKQLQFTAIDASRQTFLMSQVDVNSIYEEQEVAKSALQNALEQAERANCVKTDFLSRMSHDMRTPMNAILGFSGFGLDCEQLVDAKDCFRKIQGSGEYLLQLINDTLDLSKLEAKTLTVYPEPYVSAEFIETLENMLRLKAEKKGVAFSVENQGTNPQVLLFDKLRLQQVFINLLNNAIKFTPAGGHVTLMIDVEPNPEDEQMCYAIFTVADDGIGMTETFQKSKLYKPFEQEHRLENAESGTGLGLSIVKELVTAMGGTISCRSMPGKGTTFTVRLGAKIATAPAASEDSGDVCGRDLSGKRVLLCEDHPLNREIAHRLLKSMGVLVESAENGWDGLELFRMSENGYYDAILMDIRMPVCDGLETTKKIRALNRVDAKTVPIIAMTANAFHEDVQLSKAAGMNAHLSKPIQPEKLYQTLAQLVTEYSREYIKKIET